MEGVNCGGKVALAGGEFTRWTSCDDGKPHRAEQVQGRASETIAREAAEREVHVHSRRCGVSIARGRLPTEERVSDPCCKQTGHLEQCRADDPRPRPNGRRLANKRRCCEPREGVNRGGVIDKDRR